MQSSMQTGTRQLSRIFSRSWYKSKLFWLLAVIVAYTLIGFLLVPYLVKGYTHDAIRDNLGWKGGPAEVSFNPYEIALRMNDFDVADETGEKVLGFSELLVDFDAWSLFYWAWTLEPSHLNDPYGLLTIDETGDTNFGKALASHAKPSQSEPEPEPDSENAGGLPRIWIKDIALNDGSLDIRDNTQGRLIEHDVSPLNLDVSNFRTHEGENGRVKVSMTVGNSQELEWEGSLDSDPYSSEGTVSLSKVEVAGLWPYVRPYVKYEVSAGRLAAKTQYSFSWKQDAEQSLILKLADGSLEFSDIEAAIPENKAFDTASLGTIAILGAEGISYDFNAESAGVERAYMTDLQLEVIRNKEGQINVAWPYTDMPAESGAQPESATESSSETEPFKWQVGLIEIAESGVSWRDRSLAEPAEIQVNAVAMTLKDLNQNLSEAKPFTVSMQPQDSGRIKLDGTLVPASSKLQSSVKVDKLSIPIAQSYVSEVILMDLNSGTVSTEGQLTLTADDSIGGFKGVIDIEKFDSTGPLVDEELIGWESLAVKSLDLGFEPLKMDIETITLKQPYGQFVIAESGETNFSALMKKDTPAPAGDPAGAESDTAEPDEPAGSSPQITIGRVAIEDGRLHFEDNTFQPFFVLPMEKLSGSVTNLSSAQQSRSDVDLNGTIGDLGQVAIKGAANPLAEDLFVDIGIDVKNFSMTTVSPYTGRYIGKKVEKGKLKLELDYLVENGQLTASNDIVLEQFTLGESVKSEQAVDLPISLAIALLKDASGTINIDLPVSGDLNSPEFSIDGIVWEAFKNLIVKAATAPFALIGKLTGGNSADLQNVSFEPGSIALSAEAETSLEQLVKALAERPGLTLEVQGISVRPTDAPVLRQSRLEKRIQKLRKAGMDEIPAYEAYLKSKDAEPPARTKTAEDDAEVEIEDAEYVQLLYQAALDTVSITDKALRLLALDRSQAVNQKLVGELGLDADQIFLLDAELVDSSDSDDEVIMSFELSSR